MGGSFCVLQCCGNFVDWRSVFTLVFSSFVFLLGGFVVLLGLSCVQLVDVFLCVLNYVLPFGLLLLLSCC